MEKYEPMDILQEATSEEATIVKITKWVKSAYDVNNVTTFIFKKDTPKSILRLYKRSINLFWFKVSPTYEIEK